MDTARSTLARRVYQASNIRGRFVLRSGITSNEYFDKYLFESDPQLLREIADAMIPFIPQGIDALAGLELGGVPIATVLSQCTGLPTLFVRKQAKTYGTCKLVEGGDIKGRNLVIVEDVVRLRRLRNELGDRLVEADASVEVPNQVYFAIADNHSR